jgi:hypothetical protein
MCVCVFGQTSDVDVTSGDMFGGLPHHSSVEHSVQYYIMRDRVFLLWNKLREYTENEFMPKTLAKRKEQATTTLLSVIKKSKEDSQGPKTAADVKRFFRSETVTGLCMRVCVCEKKKNYVSDLDFRVLKCCWSLWLAECMGEWVGGWIYID